MMIKKRDNVNKRKIPFLWSNGKDVEHEMLISLNMKSTKKKSLKLSFLASGLKYRIFKMIPK